MPSVRAQDGQRRPASEHAQPEIAADDEATLRRALRQSERTLERTLQQVERLEREVAQLGSAVIEERKSACYDPLTGLPNRRLLHDRFQQVRARGERREKPMALLFVDLDQFKNINDSYGHLAGDHLLARVAARLLRSVRASDTVCRYGGDEFVILLAEIDNADAAMAVQRKIRGSIARPYALTPKIPGMSTSIGMAFYPSQGVTLAELIAQADRAMYEDKARQASAAPAGLPVRAPAAAGAAPLRVPRPLGVTR